MDNGTLPVINRLVVIGCSFSYGQGLPDCWPDVSRASRLGYAHILADRLGVDLELRASPGRSNRWIWHQAVRFAWQQGDLCVLQWTGPDRTHIFGRDQHIGPWQTTDYYQHYHHRLDHEISSQLYVNHANRWLKDRSVAVINTLLTPADRDILALGSERVPNLELYLWGESQRFPLGLDNLHPGLEFQHYWAEQLARVIANPCEPIGFWTRLYRRVRACA